MKRFALVALLAATLFGVSSASATELKVRGQFDVYGMWSKNLRDFNSDVGDGDNYMTTQRMRTYFDFIANENLKAVLGLEIDNVWGNDVGGKWGSDGKGNIKVKHAYLDFTLPDTDVNVKAGLQYVGLPGIFGNPVFDDDAAALVVSAPINDMFALTAGYTRGFDNMHNNQDPFDDKKKIGGANNNLDMGFLAAPITLDGFSATPYFAYFHVGEDYGDEYHKGGGANNGITSNARFFDSANGKIDGWVLGANAALTIYDPLTIEADLIYGSAKQKEGSYNNGSYKTRGWYAALAASYDFDILTATLFGTYASGAKDSNSKDNYLPTLAEGWELTPYIGGKRAFGGAHDSFATDTLGVGSDGTGIWTAGIKLSDISFVDNLSHDLTVAFAQGTSKHKYNGKRLTQFTKKDYAWELYLVNKYMIYENLAAINELGMFAPNFKNKSEHACGDDDASYFGTIGFQYKF